MEKPLKLLIIDDEVLFRKGLIRLLKTLNFCTEIHQGQDGQSLLKQLSENQYDCILIDYLMPGENGIELTKKVINKDPSQAIVMITGLGNEEVAVKAIQAGASDYLVKGSISSTSLQCAIINAIEKKEMENQIKTQQENLVQAEQQRVMVESLGSACHHLGQPATAIMLYLDVIKRQVSDPETTAMLDECLNTVTSMQEIFNQLRAVSEYKTTPYITSTENSAIVDINPEH